MDERKDVLLKQLVWILGLLGVTHVEAISPFPEETAIVAGTVRGGGGAVRAVPRWYYTKRPLLPSLATATSRMGAFNKLGSVNLRVPF